VAVHTAEYLKRYLPSAITIISPIWSTVSACSLRVSASVTTSLYESDRHMQISRHTTCLRPASLRLRFFFFGHPGKREGREEGRGGNETQGRSPYITEPVFRRGNLRFR
jgi:hypothetical protein